MPISSSTLIAEPPFLSMSLRPLKKSTIAPLASLENFVLNWSADIPATLAKFSSLSPPVSQATSMLIIILLNALPPASAPIPKLDNDAENPKISASVKLTCLPAAAILIPICIISASVVAVLLPKSTRVAPSLSTVLVPLPVIFKNLAREVDASLADRLVVSPNITAVLVKLIKLSVPSIPNWPAISITPAISSADSGIFLDIFIIASLNFLNSGSVALTVFLTPAKASS